jgi:hypothetical protein
MRQSIRTQRELPATVDRHLFIGLVATVPVASVNEVFRTTEKRRIARVVCQSKPPKGQRAVLLLIVPPSGWEPNSWRSIPPATRNMPYIVVDVREPQAAGVCRQIVKKHNQQQLRDGIRTWAICCVSDGRHRAAESEVAS